MKIIAVINQKGGVGKSTTALALGSALARLKHRVLFVDLDAQGNMSYALHADTRSGFGAFGALQNPSSVRSQLSECDEGQILASSPNLATADVVLTEIGKEYRLREALSLLADDFDYCVIDTPPALGIVTVNALTASHGALIPAQADVFSLHGINQLGLTIKTIKTYCNPDLKVLGIVLTRFNRRSVIRREVAEVLKQTAQTLDSKLLKSTIRECTALVEAQAKRSSIFQYAPRSNGALDYKALAKELLTMDEVKL
jgi:chromosome partitioning protein